MTALGVLAASTACGPKKPPPSPPPAQPVATDAIELRYAAPDGAVRHELELELNHTSVGLYVEAKLALRCEVKLGREGEDRLRADWTIVEVPTLTLEGSAAPAERDELNVLLLRDGRGTQFFGPTGVPDLAANEQATANVARQQAAARLSSPAGRLLLRTVTDQLRLPKIPTATLRIGEPVEVEEEFETVLADSKQVLPTTTVNRFTLRHIGDDGIAEIAIEHATVAEAAAPEPVAEDDPERAAPSEELEPVVTARMELRGRGTLRFDVERGLPVSLETTGTQWFEVGEQEVERSLTVRSRYSTE